MWISLNLQNDFYFAYRDRELWSSKLPSDHNPIEGGSPLREFEKNKFVQAISSVTSLCFFNNKNRKFGPMPTPHARFIGIAKLNPSSNSNSLGGWVSINFNFNTDPPTHPQEK